MFTLLPEPEAPSAAAFSPSQLLPAHHLPSLPSTAARQTFAKVQLDPVIGFKVSCVLLQHLACSRPAVFLRALVPGPPADTHILGCSSPIYKMVSCLHVTDARPPVDLQSSLDGLQYRIQCQYFVNTCYTPWRGDQLSGNFYVRPFNPQLIESAETEPADGEADCENPDSSLWARRPTQSS